ncbi:MAG: NTP transferase domain-containing protein [Chloroflexaceae bacterium]|nr:NTP transferase domain-containing protein [Chloroflexaceae bacterium]
MKAVIMAGGGGTRLRPLTINRPKPMVSIADRQAVHHIIELLKKHGITDVIITVQYLANVIQDYYSDGSNYGVNIRYSVETTPLGTAGSVKHAAHLLDDEPFLVISGDALTDIDLSRLLAFHQRTGSKATLTLTQVPNPLDFGVVIVDEYHNVQQFLEKPSWGEVFSDTVNTGIYMLDPSIFEYIEPDRMVDWSRDVFPRILEDGHKIMGYIASGYWTDVGTIEEYMRACADYLSGKVNLPRVGKHIGGGVWIENDADIAADAQLHGNIFLGHGVKIRSGVHIHGPAFIRPYSIIDAAARIDRSVVWRNSYIGERAELRGAIVLRQCDIRSQVRIFEGAVVGDGVQIGSGAVIQPNVKIWPSKEVDEGATVSSSLIWGSQARRVLFGRYGIRGLVNIEITPEFCARLGAAYGATLSRGVTVTINRDPHYTPRMLKRALIAGLPSTGVNVLDIRSVPVPVARYYTHATGAAGGIHVRLSPYDNRMAEIRFFDQRGLNLSSNAQRKIESIFFREDFRRAYLDEIGRINYGQNVEQTYIEAFLKALRADVIKDMVIRQAARETQHPHLVVDYAYAGGSDIFSQILRRLKIDVVELNANTDEHRIVQSTADIEAGMHRLMQVTPVLDAKLGVRIDSGGERIFLVDERGRRLTGMQAFAAIAWLTLRANQGGTIAVPATAPQVFEKLAARYGGRILRTKNTLGDIMQTAASHPDLLLLGDGAGSYIFPAFHPIFDGMFATIKIMELLAINDMNFSEAIAALPPYYLNRTKVPCRWESKGKVMRQLNEKYASSSPIQIDGVRIELNEEEWVLMLPDPDSPFFYIYAESTSKDQSRALAEKYAAEVAGMQ